MNTEKYNPDDVFVGCPHCLVHSLLLTKEEAEQIRAGQQMLAVCQVCSKEFLVDERNL